MYLNQIRNYEFITTDLLQNFRDISQANQVSHSQSKKYKNKTIQVSLKNMKIKPSNFQAAAALPLSKREPKERVREIVSQREREIRTYLALTSNPLKGWDEWIRLDPA